MPENFAEQPTLRDGAKSPAIGALGVCTNNEKLPGLRVDALNSFDHCTVNRMIEDHDIPRFKRPQNKRECSNNYVISLIVFGCEAVAFDFD